MYLLAASGKKMSGKDTVGNIIQKLLPKDITFHKIGFADSLYDEVARMLRNVDKRFHCCTVDQVVEHIKRNKNKFRGLMQWYGTEYRRDQFDPEYWTKQLGNKILALDNKGGNNFFYVNDCRFYNEANLIKQSGGKLWRVVRWSDDNLDSHQSEMELDQYPNFDVVLPNNGTLADLEDLVSCHLNHIIKK